MKHRTGNTWNHWIYAYCTRKHFIYYNNMNTNNYTIITITINMEHVFGVVLAPWLPTLKRKCAGRGWKREAVEVVVSISFLPFPASISKDWKLRTHTHAKPFEYPLPKLKRYAKFYKIFLMFWVINFDEIKKHLFNLF